MRQVAFSPRRSRHAALAGVTWALCALTAAVSLAQTANTGKRVALLVGVNHYDKRGFRDLEYAERDAEELAKVLESAGYEVHLLTGSAKGEKRAELKNIEKAIEAVLTGRKKDDLILVALAGHGLQIEVTGPDGKLRADSYYCPADAEQGNPKTLLAMGKLFDEIDRRGGGHNLVLVDACREDPTRGRGLDGSKVAALPEGVAVLFGCRAGQKTFETKNAGGGHGVFFHFVLEGLKGQARDDEGEVTWNSLVGYVSRRVAREAPRLVGDDTLKQSPNLVANLPGESPILLTLSAGSFAGTRAGQEWDANGLKMRFCWCPPGKFTMGSPASEADRRTDEDQVSVTLTRGFWLGKHEVTQGQWERTMRTTLREQRDKADKSFELYGEGADYPMYWVNHDEVTVFCRELTDQERRAGKLPAAWEYRLPTEAQWEYACRAETKTATAFGDKLGSDQANFDGTYPYNGAEKGESLKRTATVGGYKANAWGLHDMQGNVWEWCQDWYKEVLPGGTDPEETKQASDRVLRGGSWGNEGRSCRSAGRRKNAPGFRRPDVGFRLAAVQLSR